MNEGESSEKGGVCGTMVLMIGLSAIAGGVLGYSIAPHIDLPRMVGAIGGAFIADVLTSAFFVVTAKLFDINR